MAAPSPDIPDFFQSQTLTEPDQQQQVVVTDPHLIQEPPYLPHLSSRRCRILFISIDGFGDLPANQSMLTAPAPPASTIPPDPPLLSQQSSTLEPPQQQQQQQQQQQPWAVGLANPPKTPLALYRLPHLQRLRHSAYGLLDPVGPGLACGSDTAHLSLLGNNPNRVYRGRGALEGIGGGVSMPSGCIAFKSCLGEYDISSTEGKDYFSSISTHTTIEQMTGAAGIGPAAVSPIAGLPTTSSLPGCIDLNTCPQQPEYHALPTFAATTSEPNQPFSTTTPLIKPHDNLTPIFMPICNNRKLKEKERVCITLCEDLDRISINNDGTVKIKGVDYDVSHDDQITWGYFLTACRKELKLQLDALHRQGYTSQQLDQIKASYRSIDLLPPPIPSITYLPYPKRNSPLQTLFSKPPKTPAQQEAILQRLDSSTTSRPSTPALPSSDTPADADYVTESMPILGRSLSTSTDLDPSNTHLNPQQRLLQSYLHPPCQHCKQSHTIFGYCFCQVQYRVFHAGGHRCVVLLSHPLGLSDCVNDTDPCKPDLLLRVSAPKHPSPSALFTSMILNRLSRASALCLGLGRIVLLRGAGMSISLRSPFNITAVACTHIVAGVAMTLGSNVYNIPEPNGCLTQKLKAVAILLGLYTRSAIRDDIDNIEVMNNMYFADQFLFHPCSHPTCHLVLNTLPSPARIDLNSPPPAPLSLPSRTSTTTTTTTTTNTLAISFDTSINTHSSTTSTSPITDITTPVSPSSPHTTTSQKPRRIINSSLFNIGDAFDSFFPNITITLQAPDQPEQSLEVGYRFGHFMSFTCSCCFPDAPPTIHPHCIANRHPQLMYQAQYEHDRVYAKQVEEYITSRKNGFIMSQYRLVFAQLLRTVQRIHSSPPHLRNQPHLHHTLQLYQKLQYQLLYLNEQSQSYHNQTFTAPHQRNFFSLDESAEQPEPSTQSDSPQQQDQQQGQEAETEQPPESQHSPRPQPQPQPSTGNIPTTSSQLAQFIQTDSARNPHTLLPAQHLAALNIQTITPALNPTNFPTTFYHIKTTDDMSHEGDFLFKANVLKNTDDTIGELIALFDQSWEEWEECYANWLVHLIDGTPIPTVSVDGSFPPPPPPPGEEMDSNCPCFLAQDTPIVDDLGQPVDIPKCVCTCAMPLPPTPIIVCLLGDHSTPCSYAEHSTEPVPLMVHTIYRESPTSETQRESSLLFNDQALSSKYPNRRILEPTTHQSSRVSPTLSESNSVGGALGRVKGGDIMRFCHELAFQREHEWFILVHQLQSYAQQTILLNRG